MTSPTWGFGGPLGVPVARRNPLSGCLIGALVVVGGLLTIGVLALGALGHVLHTVGSAGSQPGTQYTAGTDPGSDNGSGNSSGSGSGSGSGSSSDNGSGNTSGTSTASSAPTASSQPAQPSASSSYQNDSYQVPSVSQNPPALPEPETYTEARSLLTSNDLYQQTVAKPVRCEMTPLDLSTASRSQLQGHLNELTGCLMRVWGPTLQKAGYVAVRPSVTIYSGQVQTQCGKLPRQNAVYCGADQQVYYAADLPELIPSSLSGSKFITESIIAHEFGHAVQARSGILVSESALADQQDDKSTKYAYSRRLELQADCFAGEFVSSIQQSTGMTSQDLGNIQKLFYSFGDDQLTDDPDIVGNHGRGADRMGWMKAGMDNQHLTTCNTWSASSSSTR